MGSATVTHLTTEQIVAERARLLEILPAPIPQAQKLAEAGLLDDEEYAALRRIEDLDWLAE